MGPSQHFATINYYKPSDEEPYFYVGQDPQGKKRTNVETEPHPAAVHDLRGKEDMVDLDKTGFRFVKHKSADTEFVDEEHIKTVYLKGVEDLLKQVTRAKRVVIFRPHY